VSATWSDIRLRTDVGIVDEPVVAPSPGVYSLVTLDNNMQTATTALFATAPLPQLIEYPNLLADLARGHIRRRGLFVWRYVPREQPPGGRLPAPRSRLPRPTRNAGSRLLMLNVPNDGLAPLVYMDVLDPHELRATISDTS
jgi:hypothetical protein